MDDQKLPVPYIALRDYLIENRGGKRAAGGRECIIRCPYCGDSKNKNSAHMYVGISHNKRTISFNCFKCNTGGDVGYEFFRKLEIYDQDLISMVLSYNRELGVDTSLSAGRYYETQYSYVAPETIIPIYNDLEYHKKLDYINRRIGGNLNFYDLQRYKIVLNLKHYLDANGIKTYSRHPKIVDELSLGFLGFLSIDNSHVIMRRLVPEEKVHENIRTRYVNYTINGHGDAFYCVPEGINQFYPNEIHLAEGPFDVLSIHTNLLAFKMNKVVMSMNGKEGLMKVLRCLIWKKKMCMFNTIFHIYLDNDVSTYDINGYRSILNNFHFMYYFHRNTYPDEKDYGVPGERIIDTML